MCVHVVCICVCVYGCVCNVRVFSVCVFSVCV